MQALHDEPDDRTYWWSRTPAERLAAIALSTCSWGATRSACDGYPRATIDLDVWVASTTENAQRLVDALREFGFDVPTLVPELFLNPASIVLFGTPPFLIALMTSIDGVGYESCRANAVTVLLDDVDVPGTWPTSSTCPETGRLARLRERRGDADYCPNFPRLLAL